MMDVRFREKFQDALAVVDQRSGARRAGHPHPRRLPLRRRHGRPVLAPLSLAALDRAGGRLPAGRGDPFRLAEVPARHAAARNLHRLALAAGGRQDRAPPARLRQDLAHGPGQDPQAGQVRHLLLPGDGPVPRHPHAQVQGQARGGLGHGRGDEQGAAGPARRRLQVHPDRRADASTSWPTPSATTTRQSSS